MVVNQLFPVGCHCEMTYGNPNSGLTRVTLWIVQFFSFSIIFPSGPICPFLLWPAIQALFCQIHKRTNYSKPSRSSLLPRRSSKPFVDGPENVMQNSFTRFSMTSTNISHSTNQSARLPKYFKPIIINSHNKIRQSELKEEKETSSVGNENELTRVFSYHFEEWILTFS